MINSGCVNFDDCKIPYKNDSDSIATNRCNTKGSDRWVGREKCGYGFKANKELYDPTSGRFPANLIISNEVLG